MKIAENFNCVTFTVNFCLGYTFSKFNKFCFCKYGFSDTRNKAITQRELSLLQLYENVE